MTEHDPRPIAPRRPDNDECCGGGCVPCVFDYYEDQLERYEIKLKEWEDRQTPDRPASSSEYAT